MSFSERWNILERSANGRRLTKAILFHLPRRACIALVLPSTLRMSVVGSNTEGQIVVRTRRRQQTWLSMLVIVCCVLWRLRQRLWKRLRRSPSAIGRPSKIEDPTFGMGIIYNPEDPHAWNVFLDGIGLPSNSPTRTHIRQLFSREDLDQQLLSLFDVLSNGGERLEREAVVNFTRGLQGQIHALLRSTDRVDLAPPTKEDQQWMASNFEVFFPAERPLTKHIFVSVAKLIILRRIVRTVIKCFGVEVLQTGLGAHLVIDVSVDLGQGNVPFRIHTVAPISAPEVQTGERLCPIEESPRKLGSCRIGQPWQSEEEAP